MTEARREVLALAPITANPQVGLLLAALEDSRGRTLAEVQTVTDAAAGWQPGDTLNSIGQLLYHVALIEVDWLLSDILHLPDDEWPEWVAGEFPIDVRDDAGRLAQVPSEPVVRSMARLARVRAHLLDALASMDDGDLHEPRAQPAYDVTPAWALHHLIQHEAEHRAQISFVRDAYARR